jgi:hypothetical protein
VKYKLGYRSDLAEFHPAGPLKGSVTHIGMRIYSCCGNYDKPCGFHHWSEVELRRQNAFAGLIGAESISQHDISCSLKPRRKERSVSP